MEFADLMIGLARDQRTKSAEKVATNARLAIAALGEREHETTERTVATMALAWAELGNGFRIAGKLRKAAVALDIANKLARATAHHIATLDVLTLTASYYERRRDLVRSEHLLRTAEHIVRRSGSIDQMARIWILQSEVADQRFEHSKAIDQLHLALHFTQPTDDSRLRLICIHNIARTLLNATLIRSSIEWLKRHEELYFVHEDRDLVYRDWLIGRALRDLGHTDGAEAVLSKVRDHFAAEGRRYEQTSAALGLLKLYAAEGRLEQARESASEVVRLARLNDLSHESLVAEAFLETPNIVRSHRYFSAW